MSHHHFVIGVPVGAERCQAAGEIVVGLVVDGLSQALDVDVTPRAAAQIEAAAAWLGMVITRQILATQFREYLRHKVTIEQLDGAKAMHHV